MSDEPAVALRPVQRADVPMILVWRNEPEVRAGMFDDRVIAAEEHSRFWSRRLEAGVPAYVIEVDGEARGLVRLDLTAQDAEVDIFIPMRWQGCGYGTAALKATAAMARALGVRRLAARIKPDNVRSKRAFEKSGFNRTGDTWQMGLG